MTKDRFKWEKKRKTKIETKLELSTSTMSRCLFCVGHSLHEPTRTYQNEKKEQR